MPVAVARWKCRTWDSPSQDTFKVRPRAAHHFGPHLGRWSSPAPLLAWCCCCWCCSLSSPPPVWAYVVIRLRLRPTARSYPPGFGHHVLAISGLGYEAARWAPWTEWAARGVCDVNESAVGRRAQRKRERPIHIFYSTKPKRWWRRATNKIRRFGQRARVEADEQGGGPWRGMGAATTPCSRSGGRTAGAAPGHGDGLGLPAAPRCVLRRPCRPRPLVDVAQHQVLRGPGDTATAVAAELAYAVEDEAVCCFNSTELHHAGFVVQPARAVRQHATVPLPRA